MKKIEHEAGVKVENQQNNYDRCAYRQTRRSAIVGPESRGYNIVIEFFYKNLKK